MRHVPTCMLTGPYLSIHNVYMVQGRSQDLGGGGLF